MRQSVSPLHILVGEWGVYVSFYEYVFVKLVVVQGCVNP